MIQSFAPPILIINGIPITFGVGIAWVESVTQNNNAILLVQGQVRANELFLLSSSTPIVQQGLGTIVQSENLSTRFQLQFSVCTQGGGLAFTDILLPLLTLTRKFLTIPCQFVYGGYYMLLGYLENYTSTEVTGEDRVVYTMDFVENIYRTFTSETQNVSYFEQTDKIALAKG